MTFLIGKNFLFFIAFIVFNCFYFVFAEKYCYNNDLEPYLHFATKTSYEFVYDKTMPEDIQGCEPSQIWLVSRHGTRNPDDDDLGPLQELNPLRNEILRNHDLRRNGDLCHEDRDNLQGWQLKTGKSMANQLSAQGKLEMSLLARRMRTNFPSLFREGYSEESFVFRHTAKERTKESAEIFAKNLFGHDRISIPKGIKDDPLIRSYSACQNWKDREDNPDTLMEVKLFQESTDVLLLIQNVSQRLGFKYNLTLDKIEAMYEMCRYDKAWNVSYTSPWCAAFSKEELMIMEFMEDLKQYYEAGYGHEINVKLGCPLVKDLVTHFRKMSAELENKGQSSSNVRQPRGIFYFTHSKALLMLLARLGIAQDEKPLKHTDFNRNGNKREWKTSILSPFAGNLAAVFYHCPGNRQGSQVMFFLQERRVLYKGCDVGLCSWRFLEEKLGPIAEKCDLKFCEPGWNSSPKTLGPPSLLLFFLISTLYSIL